MNEFTTEYWIIFQGIVDSKGRALYLGNEGWSTTKPLSARKFLTKALAERHINFLLRHKMYEFMRERDLKPLKISCTYKIVES